MTSIRPLVLTVRPSPILARLDMPKSPKLKAGDRVFVVGDTDHPTMTVLGQQLDLFEPTAPRILCTWRARGRDGKMRRHHRHFDPVDLRQVSGLIEDDAPQD